MSVHEIAPDSIDALIAKRLPAWMRTASIGRLQALHRALRAQQKSAQKMRELMAPVPALDDFAEPLLKQAVLEQFKVDIDVRVSFVRIVQTSYYPTLINSAPQLRSRQVSTQPLLAAALHNYSEEETYGDLLREATFLGGDKKRLAIEFTRFAKLCRGLDVGARYQALLKEHLQPSDTTARSVVHASLEEDLRARLEVAVRRAILESHIDERTYLQLLPFCSEHPIVPGDTAVLTCRQLSLLGKRVEGVVTLEVREQGSDQVSGIICWIPDDPLQPLQRHGSWAALYETLAVRFREKTYAEFFTRFIRERERASFTTTVNTLLKGSESASPVELDGRHAAVEGAWFVYLRQLRIERILDDARVLAVPTDDEDKAARRERFDLYVEAGLALLNLAGMFVPVLGQVMLGVAAVQIANEVYEGYQDWELGDRQAALQHLFGVAENVAVGALVVAGGVAVGKVLERLPFVDELAPIVTEAGHLKLRAHPPAHEWSGAGMLMRRLGGELSTVSDQQAARLVETTGIAEEHLRLLHLEQAAIPARLLDAWERFQIHESMPTLGDDAQILSRPAVETPEALLLKRDFPGLSSRGAQEIVDQADSQQLKEMLDTQRVPLNLAEQAHWYLRDTRVDRAIAGLRQVSAANQDTERLALGLIDLLAPWAETLRLEVRAGSNEGPVRVSIGNEEAAAQDVLCVVRGEEGYLVEDRQGLPLMQATVQDSLAQALILTLEPSQKLLLGDAALDEKTLIDKLVHAASGKREQAATLIGQAPVGEGVRLPTRLADGRLGYPLNVRVTSSLQASRRGIQQIYPTFDKDQLERYIEDLLARGVDPWLHYNRLQRQLTRLREALQAWQGAGRGVLDRLRRRRVASALRRCWRRKSSTLGDGGHWLLIRGEHVGSLPSLPTGVTYPHVTRLTLRDMDLDLLDADFLGRFPELQELDLRYNQLSEVPAGIEQLVSLRYLRLGHNRIVMNNDGNRRLLALLNVRELDLSHNPLGHAPDVDGLRHLRHLSLNATELDTLPERVEQLPWQGIADLRNNSIQHVRQDLHNLRLRLQRMVLHDNPLDGTSQALVNLAAREPRNLRPVNHQLIDQAARERWLAGSTGKLRSRREAQWLSLREDPESRDLFQFIADFAETSDFREHAEFYRGRIWRMLDACYRNTELRTILFTQAGGVRTCEDRLLLILSELETTLYVERLAAGQKLAERETALVKAGRGLYRLDEVNTIAARKVEVLERKGGEVDPIEVYLAYRTHLAEALGLPGQPDGMYYMADSRVTSGDLNSAMLQILRDETPERLSAALAQRSFWDRYVHVRYPEQVDALVAALEEQLTHAEMLSEQMYLVQSDALRTTYEMSLQALRLKLAQEAYERFLQPAAVIEG